MALWRQRVEAERGGDPDDRLFEARRLHASATWGGIVRVDGELDPETGECLLAALRAVVDVDARSAAAADDRRTPAQRRADALGEICRSWLDRSDRPMVAGERPHVTLTVDADVLAGSRSGARSELDHVGPVPATTARRLSCDASVMRVVLAAHSEPLDAGRRTKVVPPAIRRAVIVRATCRFPGCGRPHTWCDAHDVIHWADGGETSVGNLLLLCRRHHRMIDRPGGFSLETVDGHPVFRRPDGSMLEERAPP